MLYYYRLRPHTRQFLLTVSKYYETYVFTMETKLYAASVTHILDPDKKLFHGRIISRDDCFDPHSKALRLKYACAVCVCVCVWLVCVSVGVCV